MKTAPVTLSEALDVIRSQHAALLAFRHPEFSLIKDGSEGAFDDQIKAVLALSAPLILADRSAEESGILPYVRRVLAEKMENDSRISALDSFIDPNPVFATLPADEQARLKRQLDVMHELSSILGERIANFKPSGSA